MRHAARASRKARPIGEGPEHGATLCPGFIATSQHIARIHHSAAVVLVLELAHGIDGHAFRTQTPDGACKVVNTKAVVCVQASELLAVQQGRAYLLNDRNLIFHDLFSHTDGNI